MPTYRFDELMHRLTSPDWQVVLMPTGFMFLLSVHRQYGMQRRKK